MKIVIITPEKPVKREQEIINELFMAGLELLHIRKPTLPASAVRTFIMRIDKRFHDRVVVHDHLLLQQEFNLAGVHLKPSIFKESPIEASILSTSSHSVSTFQKLDREKSHIFLSPVFNSISKAGYKGNPELLKAGVIHRQGKLLALGGITASNIGEIADRGFDGAAILGYIWQSNDPIKSFYKLKELGRKPSLPTGRPMD